MTRLAITYQEAAEMLSISLRHFRSRVLPEVRTVRIGSAPRVPVAEVQRWLELQTASRSDGEEKSAAGTSVSRDWLPSS
jgi:excisionase family DNA binding protein